MNSAPSNDHLPLDWLVAVQNWLPNSHRVRSAFTARLSKLQYSPGSVSWIPTDAVFKPVFAALGCSVLTVVFRVRDRVRGVPISYLVSTVVTSVSPNLMRHGDSSLSTWTETRVMHDAADAFYLHFTKCKF